MWQLHSNAGADFWGFQDLTHFEFSLRVNVRLHVHSLFVLALLGVILCLMEGAGSRGGCRHLTFTGKGRDELRGRQSFLLMSRVSSKLQSRPTATTLTTRSNSERALHSECPQAHQDTIVHRAYLATAHKLILLEAVYRADVSNSPTALQPFLSYDCIVGCSSWIM